MWVGFQVYSLVRYRNATPLPLRPASFLLISSSVCAEDCVWSCQELSLSLSGLSYKECEECRQERVDAAPLPHSNPCISWWWASHFSWYQSTCAMPMTKTSGNVIGVKVDRAGERVKVTKEEKVVRKGLKRPRSKGNLSRRGSTLLHEAIIIRNYPNYHSALAHFTPSSLFLSHHPHLLSLPGQVFPRWFCWTQKGTWSRDRAAWKCWTTRSAGSFPGTLGLCWSSASPTPCSSTKGPASSCLWVSGPASMGAAPRGAQPGAPCLWMKWHFIWSILNVRLCGRLWEVF